MTYSTLSLIFCIFCSIWVFWLSFLAVNTRNPTLAVLSAVGVFFGGSFLMFLLGFEYLIFIFLQVYVGGIAVLFGCSLFFLTPNLLDFSFGELCLRFLIQLIFLKGWLVLYHSFMFTNYSYLFNLKNVMFSELILFADVFNYTGYIICMLVFLLLFGLIVVIGLFNNSSIKI